MTEKEFKKMLYDTLGVVIGVVAGILFVVAIIVGVMLAFKGQLPF